MTEPRETCSAWLKCMNCGDRCLHYIPRGVAITRYAESNPCRVCGCLTLRRWWL